MPLIIVRNDITKMEVDAIVNAANPSLLGGGGVDGCIHKAAGKELLAECKTLGGCKTGDAKITKGYKLPARYIIHTVGPVYENGDCGEEALLASCYKKSLFLAKEYNCSSVAFPLISSGIYGYPKADALRVATDSICKFLSEEEMTVYIVIFDKKAFEISEKIFVGIKEYIDDFYVEATEKTLSASRRILPYLAEHSVENSIYEENSAEFSQAGLYLEENLDESFSEMLLRKIDEKGIKDSECYKKANIDRKLFSKIRNDKEYKPSKPFCNCIGASLFRGRKYAEKSRLCSFAQQ